MKILNILAATALAITAIGATTAANADPRHDGRHDNVRGADWNRQHNGWNKHHRVRCHTEWRHHHRVRICR